MAEDATSSCTTPATRASASRWRVVLGTLGALIVAACATGALLYRANLASGRAPGAPQPRPAKVDQPLPNCDIGTVRNPSRWPDSGPSRRNLDDALRDELLTSRRLVKAIAHGVPRGLDLVVEFAVGADGKPTTVVLASPRQVAAADKAAIEAALLGCRLSGRLAQREATWMESDGALELIRGGRPRRVVVLPDDEPVEPPRPTR